MNRWSCHINRSGQVFLRHSVNPLQTTERSKNRDYLRGDGDKKFNHSQIFHIFSSQKYDVVVVLPNLHTNTERETLANFKRRLV